MTTASQPTPAVQDGGLVICTNFSSTSSNTSLHPLSGTVDNCDDQEDNPKWFIFFLSSIFSFVAALTFVLLGKCISCIYKRCRLVSRSDHQKISSGSGSVVDKKGLLDRQDDIGCMTAAKDWAGELISGQSNSGRILVCGVHY